MLMGRNQERQREREREYVRERYLRIREWGVG